MRLDNALTEFHHELQKKILTVHPVIWIYTQEECRAQDEIIRAIEHLRTTPTYIPDVSNFSFGVWTLTSGLHTWANPKYKELPNLKNKPDALDSNPETTTDPDRAIDWIQKYEGDIVVLFKDLHRVLTGTSGAPIYCRKLKDFVAQMQQQNQINPTAKIIIITAPVLDIPVELEKSVSILDFTLPSENELLNRFKEIIETMAEDDTNSKRLSNILPDERNEIIQLAKGLTIQEFDDAIAVSIIEKSKPISEIIKQQKRQIVIKNGILELLDPVPMNQVGGLDKLKNWLDEQSPSWTKEGQDYGLRPPKGALLLGVQGCGKSLVSRAIAHDWNKPLYKFDIAKLFSSTVGSSEATTRRVLKTLEAVAPAIVILDELDKTLSGTQSSGMSDGGVTARVTATILNWLNDHRSDIFIVATCNDIKGLPTELLRKGRFSEIFFVDLPTKKERKEIFRIHIEKIKRNPEDYDLDLLASKTDHFSGAEIQAIVEIALNKSFRDKKLKDGHLLQAIQQTVPLWATRREEIEKLISWVGRDEDKKDGVKAVYASSEAFSNGTLENDNVVLL